MKELAEAYPLCRAVLGTRTWRRLTQNIDIDPAGFPDFLEHRGGPGLPPFLAGLARIEYARLTTRAAATPHPATDAIMLNPTLQLTPVSWKNLALLFIRSARCDLERIAPGNEIVMTWRMPGDGTVMTAAADSGDLLAIKLTAEETDPADAAREAGVAVGVMDAAMREAVRKGLLISPPSKLRRERPVPETAPDAGFAAAEVFTLQWHLTQACDLHCRHCYDRSSRPDFQWERALTLLDELRDFCRRRFVRGQVTLSGGNPLLYPRFFDLYRAAAKRDFAIAILGNACDRAAVQKLVDIRMPVLYQISLEGLERHNDLIRGAGNYRRTVAFLRMLTDMGVPNAVMLTLTRQNMAQIVPLAEALEGITGGLTFNRLSLFGEGAALELPTPEEYREFLETCASALASHPVLALKDSLFNTILDGNGTELFGGCTGYGCGAAFNFVAILSDGEVHACRKFPSPIGTIMLRSLEEVYDSEAAARYRAGSSACAGCSLNAVCRGCPAITASFGLDPFTAKDPFCFSDAIPQERQEGRT
jgi:selenobiotic family peptide radical SAM maturase